MGLPKYMALETFNLNRIMVYRVFFRYLYNSKLMEIKNFPRVS